MHNKSLEEKLRLHAYHLWEADGRPEGRSTEFWEKARVLLEHELAPVIPPHEANEADAVTAKPAKKPVKPKSKVTPAGEDSVKVPKAKPKADAKPDVKVARKTATKTAAKPKTADTDVASKKPKTAAKSAAKPKAIAEVVEKPAKKPAVKVAAKVSKTSKK